MSARTLLFILSGCLTTLNPTDWNVTAALNFGIQVQNSKLLQRPVPSPLGDPPALPGILTPPSPVFRILLKDAQFQCQVFLGTLLEFGEEIFQGL